MPEDEEECADAGSKLGYPFLKKVANVYRPEGCYWYDNGRFKNSFFNTLLGANMPPYSESGEKIWSSNVGGICKEPGILEYHYLLSLEQEVFIVKTLSQ